MLKRSLNIGLIGFSGSALASLEFLLDRNSDQYVQTNCGRADVIIYNADQAIPLSEQKEDYLQDHHKPGIVVSIQDISWPEMICIKKPYSTNMLTSALAQLRNQLSSVNVTPQFEGNKNQQELEQVVESYRNDIRRSQGEGNIELNHIQREADRRKQFQQDLFARIRSVENHLERLHDQPTSVKPQENTTTTLPKSTSILEILSPHESSADKGHQADLHIHSQENLEEDILTTTAAVIAKQTPELVIETLDTHQADEIDPQEPQTTITLTNASDQDVQDCCGNLPDINLEKPNLLRQLSFNAEGQLLAMAMAAIQRAHQEENAIAITGGFAHKHLKYHPDTQQFLTNIDCDVLLQMAQVRFRFGELQLQHVKTLDQSDINTDFVCFSAEKLLWLLACFSSRGRIIDEIDLHSPYQLVLPASTHVILGLPYTSEFLALWQTEPLTAVQITQRLKTHQRFVFPFMTAAWTLGWLHKHDIPQNMYFSGVHHDLHSDHMEKNSGS